MLGVCLLIAQTQVPGLFGPLALINQCGDGGRCAGQRLGFDPCQITLMLVDLVEPAQCNQASDLSAKQRDLVGCVEPRLNPTHVHATLQDLGRLGMTIQRLQVKPQSQQLLGKAGCEGTGVGLH